MYVCAAFFPGKRVAQWQANSLATSFLLWNSKSIERLTI